LLLAALCHDIVDSKYKELSIDRKELEEYLLIAVNNDSKKQERILNIIDNISWSKEVKGLRKPMDSEMDQYLLNVVSDADRLEAIGDVGVQRCI
jgi:HD superfamily phosphodiesterase